MRLARPREQLRARAVSEMGDKTQLLAFSLAGKYRKPWVIMAGSFVATDREPRARVERRRVDRRSASRHASWRPCWPPRSSPSASGRCRPDLLDDEAKPSRFGPFLTTVVLFFLAEMGDKTQLATMALGARYPRSA